MSVVRLPRMHPHLLRHTIVKVQGGEEAGGLDLEEDLAVVEPVDVFVLVEGELGRVGVFGEVGNQLPSDRARLRSRRALRSSADTGG
jgi:hypothetical protein